VLVDRSALLPDREPIRAAGIAVTECGGVPHVLVAGYGEANRLFRGHRAEADAASDGERGDDHDRDSALVDAGSGYCCQGEPVAHFGLGGGTPRGVHVSWPDGETRTRIESPEPGQVLEVPFPE
jgi:hypothetical protein